MPVQEHVVGIDIGGTFTDIVSIDDQGVVIRAKSLTTPGDLSAGVLNSVHRLSEKLDQPVDDFLGSVSLVVNGSTIATNVMAQLRGAKLGLITTQGFEDTVRIARSYRFNSYDLHKQVAPPELVARKATIGITERIDYKGQVVVPLDEEEVRTAVRHLVDDLGVESIAISFLWSPHNPEHELAAARIVGELYPDLPVSIGHEVFSGVREYERTMTTLINAYVAPATADYIYSVESRLREAGLKGTLSVMHSMGGVIRPEETAKLPVTQILSGPVGGVCGANFLGKLIGVKNIITADVGGTSFDTSLIYDNTLQIVSRTHLEAPGNPGPGYLTGLSLVDISTVGAGGGSIAWIDPRGLLRVGPHSAGSDPGPVAFGRGGTEPTLTDACIVMGLIDPEYYLGGNLDVDSDAARKAIEEKIAKPLGMSTEEAAGAIYDVLVAAMSHNVRAVSIQKGYDPREFAMVSFGGAGGMILPAVCQESYVRELIVPGNAATFSAFGLLTTDYKRDYLRSVHWRPGGDPSDLNVSFEELREEGASDLASAGFDSAGGSYDFEVDMRFVGQFFELTIPVEHLPLGDAELKQLEEGFTARYEREYGEGTGWIGAPAEIVHARLHASAKLPSFTPQPSSNGHHNVSDAKKGTREVYLRASRERQSVTVYDIEQLLPGMELDGPAVVEGSDTTVMLLEGMHCRADEYGNLRVQVETVQ